MSTVKSSTKNLALAGIFLAVGILMPRLFHFAGQQAGTMFLPLFWGVVLTALMLPMKSVSYTHLDVYKRQMLNSLDSLLGLV